MSSLRLGDLRVGGSREQHVARVARDEAHPLVRERARGPRRVLRAAKARDATSGIPSRRALTARRESGRMGCAATTPRTRAPRSSRRRRRPPARRTRRRATRRKTHRRKNRYNRYRPRPAPRGPKRRSPRAFPRPRRGRRISWRRFRKPPRLFSRRGASAPRIAPGASTCSRSAARSRRRRRSRSADAQSPGEARGRVSVRALDQSRVTLRQRFRALERRRRSKRVLSARRRPAGRAAPRLNLLAHAWHSAARNPLSARCRSASAVVDAAAGHASRSYTRAPSNAASPAPSSPTPPSTTPAQNSARASAARANSSSADSAPRKL